MLGRLLMQTGSERVSDVAPTGAVTPNGTMTPAKTPMEPNMNAVNGKLTANGANGYFNQRKYKEIATYDSIDWYDPNIRNLVADGKLALPASSHRASNLIRFHSLNASAQALQPKCVQCVEASVR